MHMEEQLNHSFVLYYIFTTMVYIFNTHTQIHNKIKAILTYDHSSSVEKETL